MWAELASVGMLLRQPVLPGMRWSCTIHRDLRFRAPADCARCRHLAAAAEAWGERRAASEVRRPCAGLERGKAWNV